MSEVGARGETLRAVLWRQRPFVTAAAVAGLVWVGTGMPGGARVAWTLMLGLWAAGVVGAVAGVVRPGGTGRQPQGRGTGSRPERTAVEGTAFEPGAARQRGVAAELAPVLLLQNFALQLFVGLPAALVGAARLVAGPDGNSAGLAWGANALTTAIVLPLLSAVVLTCVALLAAVPVAALLQRLRGRGSVGTTLTATALAAATLAAPACAGGSARSASAAGGGEEGSGAAAAADIAAGRELYLRHGCVLCHGEQGRGDGPNASLLRPPPRDYTDPPPTRTARTWRQSRRRSPPACPRPAAACRPSRT